MGIDGPDHDSMNVEQFAQRMKAVRNQRKMSLEDVAKAAGFTKSHVWEIEQGRALNPTVRAVWGIAGALGVSPGWLMGIDPNNNRLEPLAFRIAAIIRAEIARGQIELATPKDETPDTKEPIMDKETSELIEKIEARLHTEGEG